MKRLFLSLRLSLCLGLALCLGLSNTTKAQDTTSQHVDKYQTQADIDKQVREALVKAEAEVKKANEAFAVRKEEIKREVAMATEQYNKAVELEKTQMRLNVEALRKANDEACKAMKNIDMESIHRQVQQAMDSVQKVIDSKGPQ
jgi:tryptophan 2,3-dioxygenase